ncbi:general transcription factor IIIC subunit l(2)37Cd [Osmia lignaria lignaria]|uniref:general transcription factor IIIC subunit l(2)37Cd n=1 Tax=Osmia lignaria lignaria TaxID=1437193 RepID=UPI0014782D4E|nr:general transcription factor 3C polypeptide 5 [Osmia lignaria]
MSALSDTSEEVSDTRSQKDEDFRINNYGKESDSDDSWYDVSEANNDENAGQNDEMDEQQQSGSVLPGGHRFDRKLICVKYPGNVINPEKAIETLGGIHSISTAVDTSNRRLELRFRPDDVYCKPTCGDRHNTNGFLLRVCIKKGKNAKETEGKLNDTSSVNLNDKNSGNASDLSKKAQEEQLVTELIDQVQSCSVGTSDDTHSPHKDLSSEAEAQPKDLQNVLLDSSDVTIPKTKENTMPTFDRNKYQNLSDDKDYELPELTVLGKVDTEFRFTNLCDFQYLPMAPCKDDPKTLKCIYDQIYPHNIPHYSWLKNDVLYFLPPAAFSRMDTVQQYAPKTEVNSYPDNVIGKRRKRKAGFSNFIYFSTPEVPTKPPAGIETAMKVKFVRNADFERMREIFEERPIWSKNALMYKTKFSNDRLKILLPAVAYYFVTGPWKIMWVKLGYDPRKDTSARKYQTLDYRLKAMHGLGSTVKCKRNYADYTLPYKSTPPAKQKTIVSNAGLILEQAAKKEQDLNENAYVYRKGTIPPSRQMFYQYCDVLVDEIQEMLAKLPDPVPGARCHEKRGWLPGGFDVQCREIINKQVRAVLRKQMNIPEDHPTSLPRKRGINMKRNILDSRERKRKRDSVTSTAVTTEGNS